MMATSKKLIKLSAVLDTVILIALKLLPGKFIEYKKWRFNVHKERLLSCLRN